MPESKPKLSERELDALAARYEAALEDRESVVSVFGAAHRSGPWAPAEQTRAIAGFGNVVLDFTGAELPAGATYVDGYALFGNVEIRVPASLAVEFSGLALLGNLIHRSGGADTRERLRHWLRLPRRAPEARTRLDAEALLCVRGTALFGNIVLTVV